MSSKKRHVQVGLGGRSLMYSRAIVETYAETSELVGLCDSNRGRLRQRLEWARERGVAVKGYEPRDFDRMIAECRPDCVVVTTMDCYHDLYVCRAMELGCDVITEKPMTTDQAKCQRIIDTQKKTGLNDTLTFICSYSPPRT